MVIKRFIALGDSITEGLSDPNPSGGYRGWADRTADVLAQEVLEFQYANLAIRGKLLQEIVREQLPFAQEFAIGQNSLISFHAGANNLLRPKCDLPFVTNLYNQSVAELAKTKSQILLFTIREISNPNNFLEQKWNERFIPFNENVRSAAIEYGAILIDPNQWKVAWDARMLAADRLHLSSEGHKRMAAGVLNALGFPHDDYWLAQLPPLDRKPALIEGFQSAAWAVIFGIPWLLRRATGRSSGDNRQPKYPQLVAWPVAK